MAGMLPGFITGANAKIRMDGITIAYATDVSYNVDTVTIPVEVMGRYEVLSNEPIAYGVNGSLSVVRYTKQAKIASVAGAGANGNEAANIGGTNVKFGDHMNPATMLTSKTFDLEIHQKVTQTAGATDTIQVFVVKDCRLVRRGATLNKRGVMVDSYAFVGILGGDGDGTKVGGTTSETDLS